MNYDSECLKFCAEVLGVELWPQQVRIMQAIAQRFARDSDALRGGWFLEGRCSGQHSEHLLMVEDEAASLNEEWDDMALMLGVKAFIAPRGPWVPPWERKPNRAARRK